MGPDLSHKKWTARRTAFCANSTQNLPGKTLLHHQLCVLNAFMSKRSQITWLLHKFVAPLPPLSGPGKRPPNHGQLPKSLT
jgi:hypothetical protein